MTGGAPLPDDATVLVAEEIPDSTGVDLTVGGVVLAGGTSSRFGDANKLLATLDGRPIVCRASATLIESSVDEVIVVLGHEADVVEAAVTDLDVSTVYNDDYRAGQSRSVRTGAKTAIEREWDAAVVLPGDVPLVASSTIELLVHAYANGDWSIVVPCHNGRRGNPVLFEKTQFNALLVVSGDSGGRVLFENRDDVVFLETGDDGVIRDVDTRADLEELRNA